MERIVKHMKKALLSAGIEAVRGHLKNASQEIDTLEADAIPSRQFNDRERALFMQGDAHRAIEALKVGIKALEAIKKDTEEVLKATDDQKTNRPKTGDGSL